MDVLRTPDERFANLPGYPFEPHYVDVDDGLPMHHLDEGPRDGEVVFLVHGEPSWSYLYRKMIPVFTEAGYRTIAPDLIGFGKSGKPTEVTDYTYARHVGWLARLVETLDLRDITFFGQDWGGLTGLRVAAEHPERFARIVVGNTGLPTGDAPMSKAFMQWREFSQTTPDLPIGRIINNGCGKSLSPEEIAAYEAPFPDDRYKAGARIFPALVPITPDDPAAEANRRAWQVFEQWQKPVLTTFSDSDPITAGGFRPFQERIPGAQGQPHTTIEGAGHFLQEQKGPELARVIVDWMRQTPLAG